MSLTRRARLSARPFHIFWLSRLFVLFLLSEGSLSSFIPHLGRRASRETKLAGTPFPSNYSTGRAVVLSMFDMTSLPQISFFADKMVDADLSDEALLVCFLVVALHCFLCPNSNIVPSPRYLGVFEDIENIKSYDWSGFVLRWVLDGVKSFNQVKKGGQRSGTLAGCMYYLAVVYLDHVDFSHRQIPDLFPRIQVWKLNMIKDYSYLDQKSPSVYGMRPLLDLEKTCYHKVSCSQPAAVDETGDVEFLCKLEEVCGCVVPDDLKAIVMSVIEEHCRSCVSPIPIDVVSLGDIPSKFRTLFQTLMHFACSVKSKSRDLVLKLLKVFADYDNAKGNHSSMQALLVSEYAKGNYKQARLVVYRVLQIGGVTGTALAVALFFGFGSFSVLFTNDPAVLDIAKSGVSFVTVSQPINAIVFVIDGLYYGMSDFAYAAYSMFFVGAISSAFLLATAPKLGLAGVWSGLVLFMSLRVAAGFWRFGSKGGPWKHIWSDTEVLSADTELISENVIDS